MKSEALAAAKNAYKIESECLTEMLNYFDEEAFGQAVELLANATRIGTRGCGHSGIMCQHFPPSALLHRTPLPFHFSC